MTALAKLALLALLSCGGFGACADDHVLWIAMNGGETHLQLLAEEPDPF